MLQNLWPSAATLLYTVINIISLLLHTWPQALLPAVGYPAPAGSSGIFYKGDGKQLGIQLLGALVVFLWSLALSLALFAVLKLLKLLRVPAASEVIGGCEQWMGTICSLLGVCAKLAV